MEKENVDRMAYSVEETAKKLGISKSLLYREIQQGTIEIPYHKIGNRILFSVSALEKYFNE